MPPSDEALLALVGDFYEHVDPVPPGVVERAQDAIAYDWRALTVRQPWATWIALKAKDVENRTWATKRRGPILIHAGLAFEEDAWDHPAVASKLPALVSVPTGVIIAAASIVDCHEAAGCCAPWGDQSPGVFHWALAEVHPLVAPVSCSGTLSFWRPDADVLAAVLKQLGGGS